MLHHAVAQVGLIGYAQMLLRANPHPFELQGLTTSAADGSSVVVPAAVVADHLKVLCRLASRVSAGIVPCACGNLHSGQLG